MSKITDFKLTRQITPNRIPYWVTSIEMYNPIREESEYTAEIAFSNKDEAVNAFNELTDMKTNNVPFSDWPTELSLLTMMNCFNTPPPSDATLHEFEFTFCNKNSVFFDVVGV